MKAKLYIICTFGIPEEDKFLYLLKRFSLLEIFKDISLNPGIRGKHAIMFVSLTKHKANTCAKNWLELHLFA